MKSICRLLLLVTALLFMHSCSDAQHLHYPSQYPTPKHKLEYDDTVELPKKLSLSISSGFQKRYKATIDSLKITSAKYAANAIDTFPITITNSLPDMNETMRSHLTKQESYYLEITTDEIKVYASTDQGVINALSTLEGMIEEHKAKLPTGWIVDYPDIDMRVLHLSMWPCAIEDFKLAIRLARIGHYNTLIWLNHYGVDLPIFSHLQFKKDNPEYYRKWSLEEFKDMITFVKENGIEIIPELKLLSHQKKFLNDSYPDYMYNSKTYNPESEELYKHVVYPAIDLLLELTGAKKFHIGHDEVLLFPKDPTEKFLPPEYFLKDVEKIHSYLKKRNIQIWMWSDMLYTEEEFPSMTNTGNSLNGDKGYSDLKERLPKDIIMCAWHYFGNHVEYPTVASLNALGYTTFGATWYQDHTLKKYSNFIYRFSQANQSASGMIATTWYGLSFSDQEQVIEIIQKSAEEFWNAQ